MPPLLGRLAGGLLFFLASLSAHADALPLGISGTWYNPEQSGHGLSILVHSPEHALVYWYTGDANGNPLLLYTEARYDGSTLRGDALDSRGIRFGEFNPATHRLTRWGSLELTLTSCNRLALRYNASGPAGGPAYGSGIIVMHKLAGVEVSCVEPTPTEGIFVSPELTHGEPDPINASVYRPTGLNALFSADGSVWLSFENGRRVNGTVLRLTRLGADFYFGTAHREPGKYPQGPVAFDPNTSVSALLKLQIDSRQRNYAANVESNGFELDFTLLPKGLRDATSYRRPVTLDMLAGKFESRDAWITFIYRGLSVQNDGQFEGVDGYSDGTHCRYRGQLRKLISPSVEFEANLTLSGCGERDGTYAGKAWAESFDVTGRIIGLRLATIRADAGITPLAFQFSAPRRD